MVSLMMSAAMVTLSVIFVGVITPYFMVSVLIIQTIVMSLFLMSVKILPWFSFILFLIFLGGVLVLFSYVSSLISEEILESIPFFYLNYTGIFMGSLSSMIFLLTGMEILSESWKKEGSYKLNVSELFSSSEGSMYLFVVGYLLLTLVCVTSMVKVKRGSLRLVS